MKRPLVVLMALLVPLSGCLQAPVESDSFRLGTTTSMRDSGLLDVLLEDFTSLHDIDVEYVAVVQGQRSNSVGTVMWMRLLFTHRNKKLRLFWRGMPTNAPPLHETPSSCSDRRHGTVRCLMRSRPFSKTRRVLFREVIIPERMPKNKRFGCTSTKPKARPW